MTKYAEAAFNLIVIAGQMRDDNSDFGKLCVAELEIIAEQLLVNEGIVKEFIKQLGSASNGEAFMSALKDVYELVKNNQVAAKFVVNTIKQTIGGPEKFRAHDREMNQIARENPNMAWFIDLLLT